VNLKHSDGLSLGETSDGYTPSSVTNSRLIAILGKTRESSLRSFALTFEFWVRESMYGTTIQGHVGTLLTWSLHERFVSGTPR
jgi:hypothetical protein